METAYQALKRVVDEKTSALTLAQDAYNLIANSPRIIAVKAQLFKGGNTAEWITDAEKEISDWKIKKDDAFLILGDAKTALLNASTNLTNYENSSPTVAAEIEKEKANAAFLQTKTKLMILAGIALLVGTIIFFATRKKTVKATN